MQGRGASILFPYSFEDQTRKTLIPSEMELSPNKMQISERIGIPHIQKSGFVFNLDPHRLITGFCRDERILGRNRKF